MLDNEMNEIMWIDYDGYERTGKKKPSLLCCYETNLELFGIEWIRYLNPETKLLDVEFDDIYYYDEIEDIFAINLSNHQITLAEVPATYVNIINIPYVNKAV
ncbi:MAG: hypothetical protein MR357_01220 [Anaeroplasma sp.]|nr:hypothetical protein [Anaeroplasma sp.]